jgi:hypothetical protein
MKQVFEHLAHIKQVEPDANLYAQTIRKIRRKNTISMFWVRAVACLLITFISTEFYFAVSESNSSSKDISVIIYKTNNILYHE